jgi:hypothetical protein
MKNYTVSYLSEGNEKCETIRAQDPGRAFAAVQLLHSKAQMLRAECCGGFENGFGYNCYYPPQVQRHPRKDIKPPRGLNPDETGCEMPFYNNVRSMGQSSDWKSLRDREKPRLTRKRGASWIWPTVTNRTPKTPQRPKKRQ